MEIFIQIQDESEFIRSLKTEFEKYDVNIKVSGDKRRLKSNRSGIIDNKFRLSYNGRDSSIMIKSVGLDNPHELSNSVYTTLSMLPMNLRFYKDDEFNPPNENYKNFLITELEIRFEKETVDFVKTINRTFMKLENDLNNIGNFVHFNQDNFNNYSIEIYTLQFLSNNLFEGCANRCCGNDESGFDDWIGNDRIRGIAQMDRIAFKPMNYPLIHIRPILNGGEINIPHWHTYNQVKHDFSMMKMATLENSINALASAGLIVNIVSTHLFHGLRRIIHKEPLLFDGFSIIDPNQL